MNPHLTSAKVQSIDDIKCRQERKVIHLKAKWTTSALFERTSATDRTMFKVVQINIDAISFLFLVQIEIEQRNSK